jgi:H+/Na+-translocating ferredoxin:NAD+ oxidoreductase subunit C
VQYFRFAKSTIWRQDREKRISDKSRERHEYHIFRLEREKSEKEARHKKKRDALSAGANNPDLDKKQALIQAAVERAKAKRETQNLKPKNTDNLTAEQQRMIEEVEKRRHERP